MKKYLIIGYILTYSLSLIGQIRDFRGQLIPEGRVTELSVSPDEKLWVGTYLGALYYANNFDSTWHICNYPEIFNFSLEDEYANKPTIDRISFFNSEQAIMTGYIALEKWGPKNGIYQTNDGGKTWTPIDFGGDMWIYDAFVNRNGQAWIGGSSGNVYYSNDYGENWNKCIAPQSMSIRPTTIFMIDSLKGFIGTMGHHGESSYDLLYQTNDNWTTALEIESPYGQGITEAGRVEQVICWNDYLIVNQSNDYFYRKLSSKEWIKFDQNFVNMTLDRFSNRLYAITDELNAVEAININTFKPVNAYTFKREPLNIVSINDVIYALDGDNEVYQISVDTAASTLLYSNDIEVSPPIDPQSYGDLLWGTDGRQILNYDRQKGKWYRTATVDFYIYDYYLLNEDVAILWDGLDSYRFNIQDNSVNVFRYENPLSNFLNGELISIEINCGQSCGYGGVHGGLFNQIGYTKIDTNFYTKNYTEFSIGDLGKHRREKRKKFKNTFLPDELFSVLQELNDIPYYVPVIHDLNISDEDKIFDKNNVDRLRSETSESEFINAVYVLDEYSELPRSNIILQSESVLWSTCNQWFVVNVSNNVGDTITFTKQYYADSKAYHFPWIVSQENKHFTSFSLEFSRFIDSILPKKFRGKFYFDNNVFLIEFSDYLRDKE